MNITGGILPLAKTTKKRVRIIPLGGMGEVGKNMIVYEYGNDIIIVDVGVGFPEEEMFGVDLVIPDITYLADKTAPHSRHLHHPRARGSYRLPALPAHGTRQPADLRHAADARPDQRQAARAAAAGKGDPHSDRAGRCDPGGRVHHRTVPRLPLDPRCRRLRHHDARRVDRPHGRLQIRPDAGGWPPDRFRQDRRIRQPRRPGARHGLRPCRDAGLHRLGAHHRRRVRPHLRADRRADHRRDLRLAHLAHPAGRGCRAALWAQSLPDWAQHGEQCRDGARHGLFARSAARASWM